MKYFLIGVLLLTSLSCNNKNNDDSKLNMLVGEWFNIVMEGYVDIPYLNVSKENDKILVSYMKRRGSKYEVKVELGIYNKDEIILENNKKLKLLKRDTIHFGTALFLKSKYSQSRKETYNYLKENNLNKYELTLDEFINKIEEEPEFVDETYLLYVRTHILRKHLCKYTKNEFKDLLMNR